jgi:hypothetical protein
MRYRAGGRGLELRVAGHALARCLLVRHEES